MRNIQPRWILAALVALGCGLHAAPAAVSTCWLGRAGNLSQQWRFTSNLTPTEPDSTTNSPVTCAASIMTGQFSSGWQMQLTGFGTATGFWDLGRTGSVTLLCSDVLHASNGPVYVAVEVTQWQDGGIYNELAGVTLSNALFLGRDQRQVEVGTLGYWMVDRSLWRLPPGAEAGSINIVGAFNGSIVDQVMIEAATPNSSWSGDLTLAADPGSCSKTNVTWTVPEVDGCYITAVACSPPPGSTFMVGTTAVACVATDVYGAPLVHAFKVVVQDLEPATVSILRLASGEVEVSWPLGCSESTLVAKPELLETLPWLPVSEPVQVSASRRFVVLEATGPMRFFRVRKP